MSLFQEARNLFAGLGEWFEHFGEVRFRRKQERMALKGQMASAKSGAAIAIATANSRAKIEQIEAKRDAAVAKRKSFGQMVEGILMAIANTYERRKQAWRDAKVAAHKAKAEGQQSTLATKAELQRAKAEKWRNIFRFFPYTLKWVRVQIRLTARAVSRFCQRWFDKDHRLATFTAIAVLMVVLGFILSKPRAWQAGLAALAIIGLIKLPSLWKALKEWKAKFGTNRNAANQTSQRPSSWSFSLLLALAFAAFTVYGIIIDNIWIKAFAPVASFWSMCWPILTRKSFWARCLKPAIILPPSIWMAVWLVVRFR